LGARLIDLAPACIREGLQARTRPLMMRIENLLTPQQQSQLGVLRRQGPAE
jgi:hypothetical protein